MERPSCRALLFAGGALVILCIIPLVGTVVRACIIHTHLRRRS